jgi:hypothetical protein
VISIVYGGANDSVFTVEIGIYTGHVFLWIGQLVGRGEQFVSGYGIVDNTAVWWLGSHLSSSRLVFESCYRLLLILDTWILILDVWMFYLFYSLSEPRVGYNH